MHALIASVPDCMVGAVAVAVRPYGRRATPLVACWTCGGVAGLPASRQRCNAAANATALVLKKEFINGLRPSRTTVCAGELQAGGRELNAASDELAGRRAESRVGLIALRGGVPGHVCSLDATKRESGSHRGSIEQMPRFRRCVDRLRPSRCDAGRVVLAHSAG